MAGLWMFPVKSMGGVWLEQGEFTDPRGKSAQITPAVDTVSLLGPTYTRLVLRNLHEGRITSSDVSNQLRINLKHLSELEERVFRK